MKKKEFDYHYLWVYFILSLLIGLCVGYMVSSIWSLEQSSSGEASTASRNQGCSYRLSDGAIMRIVYDQINDWHYKPIIYFNNDNAYSIAVSYVSLCQGYNTYQKYRDMTFVEFEKTVYYDRVSGVVRPPESPEYASDAIHIQGSPENVDGFFFIDGKSAHNLITTVDVLGEVYSCMTTVYY